MCWGPWMGKIHTFQIVWYKYIFMILVSTWSWYKNTILWYIFLRWYIRKNDTNDTKICIFSVFLGIVQRWKPRGLQKFHSKIFRRYEMIKILPNGFLLRVWKFLQTWFQNFSICVMQIGYILNKNRKIIEYFDTKIL